MGVTSTVGVARNLGTGILGQVWSVGAGGARTRGGLGLQRETGTSGTQGTRGMAPTLAWVSQETRHEPTLEGLGTSGRWRNTGLASGDPPLLLWESMR